MPIDHVITRSRAPRARILALGLVGALGLGLLAGQASAAPGASEHRAEMQRKGYGLPVLTVAHLGAWREAPENSVDSIELAAQLGVEIVELDVRRTSDGELVLMHDSTVDRTTDGSGAVSDLTLSQIAALHLRELRGGDDAELTNLTVPTFADAVAAADGNVLINVDKAWGHREQIWDEAAALGVEDQIIFKSDAPTSEVDDFLDDHPSALYCHVIDDDNHGVAHTFTREPDCYEIVWDDAADAQVQPDYLAGLRDVSRVWMNTMWESLAGGNTDEYSRRDISGWGHVVARGASMIQTDDPAALKHWLDGGTGSSYGMDETSVRVQAEDYIPGGQGTAYSDNDAQNRGGEYRPDEGVDVCNSRGNQHVCWIRAGEWITYTVDLPAAGAYDISARVSSPYRPAGTIELDFDDVSTGPVDIRTTTDHKHFLTQTIAEGVELGAGRQTFTMRAPTGNYQNFNMDYWQFDPA